MGPEYNNTFFLRLLLNMSNSVIKHLAECWVLSKWMMNGSYSYSYYFMARNFIKVKNLRETKHPQISNSHLFQATFMLWNSSSLKWFGFPLKLTIMRFGLHQRKAINDLIVKSNGLFSVMFLFISSVACDAIDYSYLHSFIWIPQQCFLLVLLLFQTPFLGLGFWRGLFSASWSHLLWTLPLRSPGRVNTVQQAFIQYLVWTCPSSRYWGHKDNEIGEVETLSAPCIELFSFLNA